MRTKTALVTGGGRGIGKGFADYLAENGYRVFAGVREIPSNSGTNEGVVYVKLDVADDASIVNCFQEVSSQIDSLDLLVNNAGLNKDTATAGNKEIVCELDKLSREHLLKMFDINSVAPLMVTKAFLPLLSQAEESFVVNVSSCRASFHDEAANSNANYGYRSSKVALNMMTFASINDLPQNVSTFAVHPGSVKTDMNAGGEMQPIESAESIMSIVENWQPDFNGKFMRYDGGYYPL